MNGSLRRAQAFAQRMGLRLPLLMAPMAGVPALPLATAVAQAGAMVCVHGVLIRANQPALASGARPLCRRLRGGQPVGATATGMGRGIRLGGAVLAMKACTALCMNSHRSTPWRRQVS